MHQFTTTTTAATKDIALGNTNTNTNINTTNSTTTTKKLKSGKCSNCTSGKEMTYGTSLFNFKREFCTSCKPNEGIFSARDTAEFNNGTKFKKEGYTIINTSNAIPYHLVKSILLGRNGKINTKSDHCSHIFHDSFVQLENPITT